MKESVSQLPQASHRRYARFWIFGILFLLLLYSPAWARQQDSVVMFSRLKTSDEHEKLAALEQIYKEYYRLKPLMARPYVLQSLTLARKLKDKMAEAGAYYAISYYHSVANDFDSAFYNCMIGIEISKSINSKPMLAKGYNRLGNVYRTKGEKSKAIAHLKLAIELDSTNQDNFATSCQSLGLVYADAGCPEESVYYYLKALKVREKQNRPIEVAYLYLNLGGFYCQPPYGDQGFKSFEKALALFRQEKFFKGEAYAYNLMGMTYFDRKDYQNALKYYRQSLAINALDTITLRSQYAFNLTNIGGTWFALKRYDSARIYYARSLQFSNRDQDLIPLSCTYLALGELNTRQKHFDLAIEFINKGLYYSKLANYRGQWEQAYALLSECYTARGDHEQALVYLKRGNEIKDSIVTERAQKEVANMMVKYETEKKDEQISILNDDSMAKQAKIRYAVFTILLLISIAGLMGYLAWQYYRKKLMPQVQTLQFIQDKITIEKEGDNRRLRALDKVLPPELRPFTEHLQPTSEFNKDVIVQLERLLLKDKIFLNENLTLAETSHLLGTNTSYLSRLINDHYQVNYSAFLNKYRVEEAKKMILDDQFNNFSMEGIAKSSGFRSKSTFNQVFKQATGLTPTEFAHRNGKIRVSP
jgi:tetratricopeptide (TPR) repeat protein